MILDSTFLVDVLRAGEAVADQLEAVDAAGPPFVTTVTVMELYEGIHLADSTERERAAVEEVIDGLTEIPFDRELAKRAGRISADLTTSGAQIETTDAMIAAAALSYELPVVTRNVDHFERVEDLEVVSY